MKGWLAFITITIVTLVGMALIAVVGNELGYGLNSSFVRIGMIFVSITGISTAAKVKNKINGNGNDNNVKK